MTSNAGGRRRRALRACIAGVLPALLALAYADRGSAQQPGEIGGTVRTEAGVPLAHARVTLEGSEAGALTDSLGTYRITGVVPGRYVLVVEQYGWQGQRRPLTLAAGASQRVDLVLAPEAVRLAGLVVTTTREAVRRAEVAASIESMGRSEIERIAPTHPSELFNRLAGVYVNVTGGEGHMAAIRQPKTTSPVYLYLENGVPTRSTGFFNHNALYEVNVPQAERVEVLKGPSSALYGSDAIGGTVNVLSRAPGEGAPLELGVEAGAHGFGRVLAAASGLRGADGVRAELNVTRSSGWRDATGYDRQSGTVRWDHRFGEGAVLRSLVTASRIDQQTAGTSALSEADYRDAPQRNYAPISYRQVEAVRASAAYERTGGHTLLALTPYLRWNRMELLPNWSLPYDPAISRTGHASFGALIKVRRELAPLRTRAIAGLDLDVSPGSHREWRVQTVREGRAFVDYTRGERIYDYDVTFSGVSPYLQAEASPLERLRLTGGLRLDHLSYDYRNALGPLETGPARRPASTRVRYTHLSPKLGATFSVSEALNLYGSLAHAFRAPSEGQLFRQGRASNTVGLEPVTAVNLEAGIRGDLHRFSYALAAYRMNKSNDILTFTHEDGAPEIVNAGRTRHQGVEASAGVQPLAWLRLDASWTWASHTYREWRLGNGQGYSGRTMEDAPAHFGHASVTLRPARLRGGSLAAELQAVGASWLNPENTERYRGHELLQLRADLPLGTHLRLNARMVNAFNVRYAESAAYTVARGRELAPGAPRSLYVGLRYR